jgi:hypothetical protein
MPSQLPPNVQLFPVIPTDSEIPKVHVGTTVNHNWLLQASLELAVPLWISKLQYKPMDYVLERARECGQMVASHGDIIQFKSPKSSKETVGTASAFNHLAEGIACLAFAPGGVTVFGLHWEAKHG